MPLKKAHMRPDVGLARLPAKQSFTFFYVNLWAGADVEPIEGSTHDSRG